MPTEPSISDLLPAFMDGESVAVQALWDQFFTNLCRVAHQRLRAGNLRGADAEDVALSALATIFRRLQRGDYPGIRSSDELWRLLVAVTQRKAVTMLRDEARQKRGGGKIAGESVFRNLRSAQGRGIDAVASAEPSPEFMVSMSETIARMFAALDDQERQVAILKLEGHLNGEIAQIIGRSIATVERKLNLIRSTWSSLPEVLTD